MLKGDDTFQTQVKLPLDIGQSCEYELEWNWRSIMC